MNIFALCWPSGNPLDVVELSFGREVAEVDPEHCDERLFAFLVESPEIERLIWLRFLNFFDSDARCQGLQTPGHNGADDTAGNESESASRRAATDP